MFRGFFVCLFFARWLRGSICSHERKKGRGLNSQQRSSNTRLTSEAKAAALSVGPIDTTRGRIYQHYGNHAHQRSRNTTGSQISLGSRHESPRSFLLCFMLNSKVSSGGHQQGQQGPYNRITVQVQGLMT